MVTTGPTRLQDQGYYAGSIRTLRSLLVNAAPISWSGLTSGEAVDASLPDATVRPQGAAPRARLSARDVFSSAQTPGETPSSSPEVEINNEIQARLSDRLLVYSGSLRDPYDDADASEYPLYAVCPCRLPSEGQEQAIEEVIATLNRRASGPYMIILYAAPSPSIPVAQLISYYRAFSAQARRNVKRIWIVHASLVTRFAVRLFLNTIVSGEVARKGKVKLAATLGDLARDFDPSHLPVPAEVLLHNASIEAEIPLPPSHQEVFGASCTTIPKVVVDCLAHLEEPTSIATEGIFRRVPKMSHTNLLRQAYDAGMPIKLRDWPDSAVLAASLLKLYLRSLPEPLFPTSTYATIRACPTVQAEACAYVQQVLLPSLERASDGSCSKLLLSRVMRTLGKVAANSRENKMNARNLAIVLAPCLVRSADIQEDIDLCKSISAYAFAGNREPKEVQSGTDGSLTGVLEVMIQYSDQIFREMPSASQAAASTSQSSTSGSETKSPIRTRNGTRRIFAGTAGRLGKEASYTSRPTASSRTSVQGVFARLETG